MSHLKEAREKLKTNDPETGLPGREDKIHELETFLVERLKIRQTVGEKKARVESGLVANIIGRHDNKTVFVCGVPGTGKTAVVMSVVDNLMKQSKRKNTSLHPFQYVYVNAQHVTAPEKIYNDILYRLTKLKTTSSQIAQDRLEAIFHPNEKGKESSRRFLSSTKIDLKSYKIVIIDELDLLYSEKRQSVFYSLFDWPTSHDCNLILIAIANAMDLPERYMHGRISSRLGWNKIVFEPYTSEHLEGILRSKLGPTLLSKCFDKVAITVATKRIGKTTGDARRIIDTCCLAVDEAIAEKAPKVTASIVDRVGFQNVERMKVLLVQNCQPLEILTLQGILKEVNNHGEDNVLALGVYKQIVHALKNAEDPWCKEFMLGHDYFEQILNTLNGIGLICMEMSRYLLSRHLSIRDKSEVFRDVIRNKEIKIVR